MMMATTKCNEFAYLVVQISRFAELLNGDVHTIAPIVTRIGWNVDSLVLVVLPAQISIDGKPILKT